MPTNRTRRSRTQTGLDEYRRLDLVHGPMTNLLAGMGYGDMFLDGCNHWTEAQWAQVFAAMREDWRRHGPEILREMPPGERPWAWWEFDAPELRPAGGWREQMGGRGGSDR
jgi:hypothetical protein